MPQEYKALRKLVETEREFQERNWFLKFKEVY